MCIHFNHFDCRRIAFSYLGINMDVIIGTMSAIGLGISLSLKIVWQMSQEAFKFF